MKFKELNIQAKIRRARRSLLADKEKILRENSEFKIRNYWEKEKERQAWD